MARLTAAGKQKLYRDRLKNNPEKYEENKRKHREHYHKVKRLAKDFSPKERQQANLIWKLRQREYRKRRKNLQSIIDVTPPSSPLPRVQDIQAVHQPPPAPPVSNASRGRERKK
ncbi:unnamed protein product [Parnassius apollo]|uniref:(apollo) hypothetical protein n=1 Tax=Parnassius apollo TaxID=110799 RepID=A0A8S3Y0V4_PARAO|nr:unnamed protein product [Parnassius apollo]